jgi:hypothetical protein
VQYLRDDKSFFTPAAVFLLPRTSQIWRENIFLFVT